MQPRKITPSAKVSNLISRISRYYDQGEYERDAYSTAEGRRLLNNELPGLIDEYVKEQRRAAYELALKTCAISQNESSLPVSEGS